MGRRIYINIYRPLGTQCVHTSSSFPFKNNIHSWWKTAGLFQRVLGGELCNGGQKDAATEVGTPKGATEEGGLPSAPALPGACGRTATLVAPKQKIKNKK